MRRAVQIMTEAGSWDEAYGILRALGMQDGYMGGRLWAPAFGDGWRVQTFHEPAEAGCWLPDGCRHVMIPAGLAASLGLEGER